MTGLIAVTGASGFIGRRTVATLVEKGHRVRILLRGRTRKILNALFSPEIMAKTDVVEGNLHDGPALARLTRNASAVIHLAGATAALNCNHLHHVNAAGSRAIAEAARANGVRRFVQVSSMAARCPGLCCPYGDSKLAGEKAIEDVLDPSCWSILRPPAVYGPGDPATWPLIAQLTRSHGFFPGTPDARFSLLYVDDLAEALVFLATQTAPSGMIHELHDGKADGYDWPELSRIAAQAQGKSIKLHYLPRPAMKALATLNQARCFLARRAAVLSPHKIAQLYHPDWVARRALLEDYAAWRPRVDFAQGFARTVAWGCRSGHAPAALATQRDRRSVRSGCAA